MKALGATAPAQGETGPLCEPLREVRVTADQYEAFDESHRKMNPDHYAGEWGERAARLRAAEAALSSIAKLPPAAQDRVKRLIVELRQGGAGG